MTDQQKPQPQVAFHAFMANATNEDLAMMPPRARGLVMIVGSIGNQTGDEFKAILAELLAPDSTFNPDVAALPKNSAELPSLLVHRNVQVNVHYRLRSAHTIANSLYDNAVDKALALELPHTTLNPARNRLDNASGPAA